MHRQDDANREAGHRDERSGTKAELQQVPEDFVSVVGRPECLDQRAAGEDRQLADEYQQPDHRRAYAIDERNLMHSRAGTPAIVNGALCGGRG
jgi:hypothetical protein